MGKIIGENLNLKSKLNIVSGIIANAKKDLESLKTEIKDVKSDHAMSKKLLNSLNNDFIECLKDSLEVSDNLMKIDNDILMTKNECYVHIKNRCHVIKSDTLITKANCIKLKSMSQKNVMSLKNIKNNLYKSNKRVKIRSILINIKVNRFNKRFNCFNKRFNRFINKPSSKTNAAQ